MGEVPADAYALAQRLAGAAGRAGLGIAEPDAIVDIVADRLDARIAAGESLKLPPGKIGEIVAVAVTAGHEKQHDLVGKTGDGREFSVWRRLVRPAAVLDLEII